jgi:hypothetical protein
LGKHLKRYEFLVLGFECGVRFAQDGFTPPLSLALSSEGRGDDLFECTDGIELGCADRLSGYLLC